VLNGEFQIYKFKFNRIARIETVTV